MLTCPPAQLFIVKDHCTVVSLPLAPYNIYAAEIRDYLITYKKKENKVFVFFISIRKYFAFHSYLLNGLSYKVRLHIYSTLR